VGQTVQRNPSGPFHHNRTTNKEKNGGAPMHAPTTATSAHFSEPNSGGLSLSVILGVAPVGVLAIILLALLVG
jgi:hypothetical protein